jgi:uncharacterized protein with PhoU and TrkA domain
MKLKNKKKRSLLNSRLFILARADDESSEKIEQGDVLIALGETKDLKQLEEMLNPEGSRS